MGTSIICNKKECFKCHTTYNIHRHHIYYGSANRKKSEEDGCWIYLCGRHHNLSNDGIHFNKEFDLKIKKLTQGIWLKTYNKTTEEFIKRFGRSYL